MTTPSTSAVRAWARDNGYDVADRGRLPAELTDAYLAAQGKGGRAAAKPTAKKAAPAKRATAAKKPAPAKKPAAAAAEPAPTAPAADADAGNVAPAAPQPKPSPVNDDRRLVALGEQLAALTDRVAALEKALGSKPNGKTGAMRFRRSR